MLKLYGTIEYLPGGRHAIINLTDANGGWQGAERIELPRAKHGRSALYEQGYAAADRKATHKGGRLETFRAIKT